MRAPDGLAALALAAALTGVGTLPFASSAQEQTDNAVVGAGDEPPGDRRLADDSPELAALRSARNALAEAGDFEAAIGPARTLVETRAEDDPRLPLDLSRLALIETETGDFTSAELHYLRAIELAEQSEGEFSLVLVEPYQGLGRSYIKNRQFAEAVTALEQAQHISQRNLGLFNVAQSNLVDDLTNAYLGLGDTATALDLQRDRLDNAVRRFGEDSLEVVPYRYALAGYYDQSRLREAARDQYLAIVEAVQSRPEQISETLRALRQLMRTEMLLGTGDDARTQVLELLATADVPPQDRAASLLALGDWSFAREDLESGRDFYARAHAALAPLLGADAVATESPAMLDFVAPLSPVDRGASSRKAYAWGTIVLEFDVSADGRAANVHTVSSSPPGLVDAAYERRIRETHFRPRLSDGMPEPVRGLRFSHYFRHYVDD